MLNEKQECIDYSFASMIKDISDKSDSTGDNRLSHDVNCKIFEDVFSCGYDQIIGFLHNNHYLSEGFEYPEYFVHGLIGLMKSESFDQISLLKLWAIGMALLDWRNDSNQIVISSLQRAIEHYAEINGIQDIRKLLSHYGHAYSDLATDYLYSSENEGQNDEHEEAGYSHITDDEISNYLDGQSIKQKNIISFVLAQTQKGEYNKEMLLRLLDFELKKNVWNIEYNSIVASILQSLPLEDTEPIIHRFLNACLVDDKDHVLRIQPVLSLWMIPQQEIAYAKDGMEELIHMHKMWMSSANHFQEPEIKDNYSYVDLIDWENIVDIFSLFYQVIKLLILSEDADAVRTALSGLFSLQCIDESYITAIERDWNQFHYYAKEWLLMNYELLLDCSNHQREIIKNCVKAHCTDEWFNVALYANLLMDNIDTSFSRKISEQTFFSSVPSFGSRRFIKAPHRGSAIYGTDVVRQKIHMLEKFTGYDCSDIEERTLAYPIPDKSFDLVQLKRYRSFYRIELNRTICSLFNVLYVDWYTGRWTHLENELARAILSSSEPYALLVSPRIWPYNNHTIPCIGSEINTLSEEEKRIRCKDIFEMGISQDEMVVAGYFCGYLENASISGYCISCFDYPDCENDALKTVEYNSRFFLFSRDDFNEKRRFNITLHHNGLESFKDSLFPCGFSKNALLALGWSISLSIDGFALVNKDGNQIGHLEYYYGVEGYNRDYTNQPLLQRWIIRKAAIEKEDIKLKVLYKTIYERD